MRFLLAFALCFVSVFVNAQTAPPMVLGGPQGIDVTRILARNWMSIPIYSDTPAAPLTGSGWPGRGYIIQVAKVGDTSVWQYNGQKWAKIGGFAENNYTYLESGGSYSPFPLLNRLLVKTSVYYIQGVKYTSALTLVNGFSKTPNSNARIDAIVLGPSGPSIIQGNESIRPLSPPIPANRLKLGFIYYPPFDSLPDATGSELTSVFRIPGRDSIYFTSGDTTIAVKDSIGLSTGDTTTMLAGYVNTASNGLTKTGKNIRLGGALNQTTNIALSGNPINIIGSADTSRFFTNGNLVVGYRTNQNPFPEDSTYRFAVNGTSRLNGVVTYKGDLLPQNTPNAYTLGITQGASFSTLRNYRSNGTTNIQQFEFGDNNTSLNTAGTLSSPSAANYGLRIYGNNTGVDSGGGSNTNFRISPTINYASNFKKAIHMGLSYEPTVQSLNNTTHIAFRNTRGSNLFNVNSGNTLIGYDTTSAAYQVDTTYKLDVNGDSRVTGAIYQRMDVADSIAFARSQSINLLTGAAQPTTRQGIFIGNGTFNNTSSNVSIGIGHLVNVGSGTGNVAIGYTSNASGGGIAIGSGGNTASATSGGVAIGQGAATTSSISIGGFTSSSNGGLAIGSQTSANGFVSVAIGNAAQTTASHAISITDRGSANFVNSISLGLFGTTTATNQLVIGGNDASNAYGINDVYIGSGVRNASKLAGKDVTYNGSGAGDSANMAGGNIRIAGGKGTGNGTPGSVIFSTSSDTTSGTALQTLKERARINQNGNLLVGTAIDNGSRVNVNGSVRASGDTNFVSYWIPNGMAIRGANTGGQIYIDGDPSLGGTVNYRANTHSFGGQINAQNIVGANIKLTTTNPVLEVEGTTIGVPSFRITKKDTSTWYFENSRNISKMLEITNDISGVTQPAIAIADSRVVCIGTRTVDTSSVLNVSSTTKGFLQPRMTNTERNAITTPATGLQLFSTTDSANYVYRGTGGGWQKIANEISGSATLDFPSTGHGNSYDIAFTVTGAAEGDVVALGIPNSAIVANSTFTSWVSAANEVTVRFNNYASSGSVDPASGTFKIKVFK